MVLSEMRPTQPTGRKALRLVLALAGLDGHGPADGQGAHPEGVGTGADAVEAEA